MRWPLLILLTACPLAQYLCIPITDDQIRERNNQMREIHSAPPDLIGDDRTDTDSGDESASTAESLRYGDIPQQRDNGDDSHNELTSFRLSDDSLDIPLIDRRTRQTSGYENEVRHQQNGIMHALLGIILHFVSVLLQSRNTTTSTALPATPPNIHLDNRGRIILPVPVDAGQRNGLNSISNNHENLLPQIVTQQQSEQPHGLFETFLYFATGDYGVFLQERPANREADTYKIEKAILDQQLPSSSLESLTEVEEDLCSICQELLSLPTESGAIDVVRLFKCNHDYHTECLLRWVRAPNSAQNCPQCRGSLML